MATDYSTRAREMMFEDDSAGGVDNDRYESKGHTDSYESYADTEEYEGKAEANAEDSASGAAFLSAQQSSKSALEFAAVSEQEKQALRLDLSSYLQDMSTKKGSDGESLIHVPSNFDEVADSMGRADLLLPTGDSDGHRSNGPAAAGGGGTSDVPWSQYLLSRDAAFGATLETGPDTGRYAGVGEEEAEKEAGN